MKGKILNFDNVTNEGVISGDDNNRYSFYISDWKSNENITNGCVVDFVVTNGKATDIYPPEAEWLKHLNTNGSGKSKIFAVLFAFFLGAFGAHKFYLGYMSTGITMLLVFFFGFVFLGIPSLIISLIAFIEFIIYLTKSDEDFDRIYVQGRKSWF